MKTHRNLALCRFINVLIIILSVISFIWGYMLSLNNDSYLPLKSFSAMKNSFLSKIIPGDVEMNKTGSDIERKKKSFKTTVTKEEMKMFRTLLADFTEGLPPNVTYFLYGGTLLGSYRHHGMIPWDDDLDLLVRDKDKHVLLNHISSLSDYKLNTGGQFSWRLFHRSAMETRFGWKWPFVDLFFYLENDTCIWDSHPMMQHRKYMKTDMFPLTGRPFMGMMLPAPRNVEVVLRSLYDLDICESGFYDHKNDIFMGRSSVVKLPCKELFDKFPFVQREYAFNKIVERLVDKHSNEAIQQLNTYAVIQ